MKASGKTERCDKFPVFKDNDGTVKGPTQKQVESRSLELGLHRVHRMVQGKDLFARDENSHQSCRKSFNLKYINHSVVLDSIQDRVIEHNEIVQLASLRISTYMSWR